MEPIGYYTDCDTCLCEDCAAGLKDEEIFATVFPDTEADCPTHCAECEEIIPHALTIDGVIYVTERIMEHYLDKSQGRSWVLALWWDTYRDEILDHLDGGFEKSVRHVYVSTFCNFPHDLQTGRPIRHECRTIPPSALQAERAGAFDLANHLMREGQ